MRERERGGTVLSIAADSDVGGGYTVSLSPAFCLSLSSDGSKEDSINTLLLLQQVV